MSDPTIPGAAAHLDTLSSYASDASCVEGGPRHLSPTSGRILRALGSDRVATCRELTVELGLEPARCLVALDRLVEVADEGGDGRAELARAQQDHRRDGAGQPSTTRSFGGSNAVWMLAEHSEAPGALSWAVGVETTRRHVALLLQCLDLDGVSPGRDLLRYLEAHNLSG